MQRVGRPGPPRWWWRRPTVGVILRCEVGAGREYNTVVTDAEVSTCEGSTMGADLQCVCVCGGCRRATVLWAMVKHQRSCRLESPPQRVRVHNTGIPPEHVHVVWPSSEISPRVSLSPHRSNTHTFQPPQYSAGPPKSENDRRCGKMGPGGDAASVPKACRNAEGGNGRQWPSLRCPDHCLDQLVDQRQHDHDHQCPAERLRAASNGHAASSTPE